MSAWLRDLVLAALVALLPAAAAAQSIVTAQATPSSFGPGATLTGWLRSGQLRDKDLLQDITERNSPIDIGELDVFAHRHRLRLPGAYQEFLLRYNGGRPVPDVFSISGCEDNPRGVVQAFFGLNTGIPALDLGKVLDEYATLIPNGLLPIACTEGDEWICLDLRRLGSPVVYWDRRPFWGSNLWDEDDLYPVADDFDAFLSTLHDWGDSG